MLLLLVMYADRHAREAGSGDTSCTVVSGVPESAGNADRHAREYNGHAPPTVVVISRASMIAHNFLTSRLSIDKDTSADMFGVECVKVMIGIKLLYITA